MALDKDISYSGQQQIDTLDSGVRIEEGRNRLVISENNINMLVATKDGFVLNDGTHNRMIIGLMPDGNIGIVISKPGYDVYDIFS